MTRPSNTTPATSVRRRKPAAKQRHAPGHTHEPLRFPRGFLWGSATSAYQVEGNNAQSDWWEWEQKKGHVAHNERSRMACDHYNRYEEDFDLAKQYHQNSHRLSIEWSRIEPAPGEWNWEEVEHYRAVLRALKKRRISVMLTLHHFTNPLWFVALGGWEHPDAPRLFARYAEFIAEHLGEYVDTWITINEPLVYIAESYVVGEWPPQYRSYWRALRVFRRLVRAHRLAYHEIHAEMKKQKRVASVGTAQNLISLVAYQNTVLNFLYVRVSELVWNELFLRLTRHTHDFIGVNYYFHQRVNRKESGGFLYVDVRKEKRESSDLGWEVFAPGIFDVLIRLGRYHTPVYITENGIAAVNDDRRIRFILSHLKEVYHAIHAGVDVRGYFYWSLLDNFEWDKGFGPRFGLIEVDYKTMKRIPRPSMLIYGQIAEHNGIDHSLMRFLGHGVQLKDVCPTCLIKPYGTPH